MVPGAACCCERRAKTVAEKRWPSSISTNTSSLCTRPPSCLQLPAVIIVASTVTEIVFRVLPSFSRVVSAHYCDVRLRQHVAQKFVPQGIEPPCRHTKLATKALGCCCIEHLCKQKISPPNSRVGGSPNVPVTTRGPCTTTTSSCMYHYTSAFAGVA